MALEKTSLAGPALLLVLTRILNMGLGLVMVPVLIHALGGEAFGAWAVLLGCGAFFGALETGMPSALVKHLAVPVENGRLGEASRLFHTVVLIVVGIYAAVLPCVALASPALGAWLKLPKTPLLTAGQMVTVVFLATAARAVLQLGTAAFVAGRAFRLVAAVSFLQPFVSNLGATVAAMFSRRVDVTLLAYWGLQLAVLGVSFGLASQRLGAWGPRSSSSRARVWVDLLSFGFTVQVGDLAHTLNFNFNKLLVARVLGLPSVAGYEVASRGALALRSIPGAGLETFLPTATIQNEQGVDAHRRLQAMLVLSLYGTLVFIGAPLAVGPVLLYGWVGEMGFVYRWVFMALGLASAASLLSMPIVTMAQAMGRPAFQAQAALFSVVVNLAVGSFLMVSCGAEGAAIAAALSVVSSLCLLAHRVHRALGLRFRETVGTLLASRWPPIAVCLLWGLSVHWGFGRWLYAKPMADRYTVPARAVGLLGCAALYAGCLAAMIGIQVLTGGFDQNERAVPQRIRAWLRWRRPVGGRNPRADGPLAP